MQAPSERRWRRRAILAFAFPALPALAWCLFMRPEAPTLLAPLFGPWAGHLYGHQDCTMANQMPVPSLVAAVLGVVALGLALFGRRTILLVPGVLWSLAWSALAVLSVVNTTS